MRQHVRTWKHHCSTAGKLRRNQHTARSSSHGLIYLWVSLLSWRGPARDLLPRAAGFLLALPRRRTGHRRSPTD
jgi:hypothetical protein